MANFNKVILAGNLTRDPELRYTPQGTAIAEIGMAINRSWKTPTGEAREEVTFVDVAAFGRTGEVIAQYLKKGRPILIEGRLKLDTWEDKQTNQKKSKLRVICENFQFLDSGKTSDGTGAVSAAPANRPARPTPAAPPPAESSNEELPPEDDVPF